MKTTLFILLITFTFSNAFFFRGSDNLVDLIDENDASGIEDYFTAYWAHFGLKKPEQLLKCYGRKQAYLYFKHFDLVNDLVQHSERREKHKVHHDFVKLIALSKALEPSSNCAAKTQDLQDLFNALNITDRNPELLGISSFIHYQANFGELTQQIPPILDALKQKDFINAGDLVGDLTNSTNQEIQKQGTALLALKGLWNGVHIGLDLPDAESILECWNNETAGIGLKFIYEMSMAVAHGKLRDAAYNTEKWYEEEGEELASKIPEDTWKCWANSADTKKESEKLNIDTTSMEFFDKVKKFVLSRQEVYWKIQRIIMESLEHHNFIHAGSAYGHFFEVAANDSDDLSFD